MFCVRNNMLFVATRLGIDVTETDRLIPTAPQGTGASGTGAPGVVEGEVDLSPGATMDEPNTDTLAQRQVSLSPDKDVEELIKEETAVDPAPTLKPAAPLPQPKPKSL